MATAASTYTQQQPTLQVTRFANHSKSAADIEIAYNNNGDDYLYIFLYYILL